MAKVEGIGGVFFRARDPAALAEWYQRHLGVDPVPTSYDSMPWTTAEGITVFAPFPADTDYFPADRAFMLNFRVGDLAAMVAELRAAGIEVSEPDRQPNGSFARLADPEGNPIELWQPATP